MKLSLATLALSASIVQAARWFRGGGGGGQTSSTLDSEEKKDLIFMREEEKVARDVYLALYDKWGAQVFQNIAGSEQTHMDRMLEMISLYGLQDPVGNRGPGEFKNKGLQAMYDTLIAQGNASLKAALRVGGLIEETDISDLEEAIITTDEGRLDKVYGNLRRASENHLRAFVTQYEASYGTYIPQVLDQSEVNAILN